MKKEMWGIFGILLFVSLGFVSAGWFSFLKPTGNVISSSVAVNLSNTYCSQADGLIGEIADQYIDDFGTTGAGDSLQIYCRNHILRLCLSKEDCPWRTAISSSDLTTCTGNYGSDSKMVTIDNSSLLSGIIIADFARLKTNKIDVYCNKNWSLTKPVVVSSCIDSDGGINETVFGKVVTSEITREDYCFESGAGVKVVEVVEFYCDSNNQLGGKEIVCSSGKCVNGACVVSSTPVPAVCVDSDGGIDYSIKGNITGLGWTNKTIFGTDSCINKSSYPKIINDVFESELLAEYYCKNKTLNDPSVGEVYFDVFTCPNGCSNGACLISNNSNSNIVSLNETCTDSDGGLNYNVNGIVNDTNFPFLEEDYCSTTKNLQETSCSNGELLRSSYNCPVLCSDGACVNQTANYSGTCSSILNLMQKLAMDGNLSSLIGTSLKSRVSDYRTYNDKYSFWANPSGKNYILIESNVSGFQESFSVSNDRYYSDESYNQDAYYYLEVQVYSDLKEGEYPFLQDEIDNRWGSICKKVVSNNQAYYICQYIGDALYSAKNNNAEEERRDNVIFWANKNVVSSLRISERSAHYSNDDVENKVNQASYALEDVADTLQKLNNNYYQWVNFDTYGLSQNAILSKLLSVCPSTLSLENTSSEQQPQWVCALEPTQCPPHGYQNQKCVDINNILPDKEQRVSCNPGVCAGCMMPKWQDATGYSKTDTKCLPYGFRMAFEEGEITRIYISDMDGLEEETGMSLKMSPLNGLSESTEGSLLVTLNQTFPINLTLNGISYGKPGDSKAISSGEFYIVKLQEGKYSEEYKLQIEEVHYDKNISKQYVEIKFTQSIPMYCDVNGEMTQQRVKDYEGNWAKCQNNYECESNVCSSGECIEVQDMLDSAGRMKSIGVRVLCRLAYIFNEDNYNSCVYKFVQ